MSNFLFPKETIGDSKQSVRVATTTNITLSGTQTIDGITLVVGDRILVKDQTTASQNGIYDVSSGAWIRSSDADNSAKMKPGTIIYVDEGTINADSGWILSTDGNIVLGTTTLKFEEVSSKYYVKGNENVKLDKRLFIKNSNSTTAEPNVTLALGDTDTGFDWDSDGAFSLVSNNVDKIKFTSADTNILNTLKVNNNVVFHNGNKSSYLVSTSEHGFMSSTDKSKLDGVSIGANKVQDSTTNGNILIDGIETNVYTPPAATPASDVTEDSSHRFVSDTQISNWDGKLDRSGGTMIGNIVFSDDVEGIFWSRNTDGASIKFKNTSDGDTDSYLEFNTNDNGNEYFKWTYTSGAVTTESMNLKGQNLTVVGSVTANSFNGNAATTTKLATARTITLSGDVSGSTSFDGSANVTLTATVADDSHNHTIANIDGLQTALDGKAASSHNHDATYVNINGDSMTGSLSVAGDITVTGTLYAQAKSFLIEHPTKKGQKLRYGSLEGPENGVYVRGKLVRSDVIELPEYWTKLVDYDSITVQLTPRGSYQKLYVRGVLDNKVYVGIEDLLVRDINCAFLILAERIDVEKLEVEIQ